MDNTSHLPRGVGALLVRSAVVLGAGLMIVRAASAGIEEVLVTKAMDDKAIIQRSNGQQYLIEKGTGCFSLWRYDGHRVLISSPGTFLGTGSRLIIPERDQHCRIWSAELIGSASPGAGGAKSPASAIAPESLAVALQLALQIVGHDPGPADGVIGEGTTAALAAYARKKGYDASAMGLRVTLATLALDVLESREKNPAALRLSERVAHMAKTGAWGSPAVTAGCEDGHWVQSKASDGEIIVLEDGSVWEIDVVDRLETFLWLPTEAVAICGQRLINTDTGDVVSATRLR
jgi:hypothetical protein